MTLEERARRVLDASQAEERKSLGYLSPPACASALAVTSEFIRGEIKAGRLTARVFSRPSGRSKYRIDPEDFRAYVEQHWPRKVFHESR